MDLYNLGFTDKIKNLIDVDEYSDYKIARVISVHKEKYIIQTVSNTLNAEITGNLRYHAKNSESFPVVGDWVKISELDNNNAIILEIIQRFSILKRKSINKYAEYQIIASNIDYAFIVQSVGHDFNLNRLERYLVICNSSKIKPIFILTKIDLIQKNELEDLIEKIKLRVKNVPIILISIISKNNLEMLNDIFEPFKTYCFIGSSGVGKSTIINYLKGFDILKTKEVSSSNNKGKHTTTHRELIVLENKSIVIDTPGMREVGILDDNESIELTYDKFTELSKNCKFSDCKHETEKGCSILEAVESVDILKEAYENYKKLKKEKDYFSNSIKEKREKDRKLGKLYKSIKNEKKKFKY